MDDMLKVVRSNSREQITMIRTRPLTQTDLVKCQDQKIKIEDNDKSENVS